MIEKKIEYIKADNIYCDQDMNYYLRDDNGNYRFISQITIIDRKEQNGNS